MMGHKKEGPERHSLKFGDSIVQPMINVLKFLLGEGGAKKKSSQPDMLEKMKFLFFEPS